MIDRVTDTNLRFYVYLDAHEMKEQVIHINLQCVHNHLSITTIDK